MSVIKTPNYNLNKPAYEEFADIADLNENADIIDDALADKVDKLINKGLSANDYTDAEKQKLAGIEAGATNTAGAYYTKEEADENITGSIYSHNIDENAHGDLRAATMGFESRISALETILGGGISTNLFNVSFTTLADVTVTGVWNRQQERIDF